MATGPRLSTPCKPTPPLGQLDQIPKTTQKHAPLLASRSPTWLDDARTQRIRWAFSPPADTYSKVAHAEQSLCFSA
jgi:hypothetical protein